MQTLIKTRSKSKIENSTHTSRDEPCTSAHLRITNQKYNCDELELAKKKKCIFCTIYLAWRNFFNICVLSKFIVYWTNFQYIWTFTSQKHYFIHSKNHQKPPVPVKCTKILTIVGILIFLNLTLLAKILKSKYLLASVSYEVTNQETICFN